MMMQGALPMMMQQGQGQGQGTLAMGGLLELLQGLNPQDPRTPGINPGAAGDMDLQGLLAAMQGGMGGLPGGLPIGLNPQMLMQGLGT